MSDDEYYDDDFDEGLDTSAPNAAKDHHHDLHTKIATLEKKVDELDEELMYARMKIKKLQQKGGGGNSTSSSSSSSSRSSSSGRSRSRGDDPPHRVVAQQWAENKDCWAPMEADFDKIKLGEQISGGGFCIMYAGHWRGTKVAVKRIFDPRITDKLRAEFATEVRLFSYLRHPHIVQMLACVSKPPSLCILTEFMARGSLYHVLHQSRVDMTSERCIRVSLQIARGLCFMHESGVIHRDLKSYNVVCDDHLLCKLCDFGMARFQLDDEKKRSGALDNKSEQSDEMGTPQYMAPELFMKGGHASTKSDVYACAILFWEIWSRDIPWEGQEITRIKADVQKDVRPDHYACRDMPEKLRDLMCRMWHTDPKKRPSMADVVSAFERFE